MRYFISCRFIRKECEKAAPNERPWIAHSLPRKLRILSATQTALSKRSIKNIPVEHKMFKLAMSAVETENAKLNHDNSDNNDMYNLCRYKWQKNIF